jgi:hypothetical protein
VKGSWTDGAQSRRACRCSVCARDAVSTTTFQRFSCRSGLHFPYKTLFSFYIRKAHLSESAVTLTCICFLSQARLSHFLYSLRNNTDHSAAAQAKRTSPRWRRTRQGALGYLARPFQSRSTARGSTSPVSFLITIAATTAS